MKKSENIPDWLSRIEHFAVADKRFSYLMHLLKRV
jgi:hypothetical protein